MSSGFGDATFSGGVTWIGEPRQTKGYNGKPPRTVINLSVAVSKDKFNSETNQWDQDAGGKYYVSVAAFGHIADNVIKSFKPGDRVLVHGRIEPKPDYTDSKGVEHQNEWQLIADDIGASLSIWPQKAVRESKNGGSGPAPSSAKPSAPAKKTAPVTAPASSDDEDDDW